MAEKLSQNFTLEEMIASSTAKAKGISNVPTAQHKNNLKYLCVSILEPLRALLNEKYKTYNKKAVKSVSIKVSSGYRSSALNKAVGGSSTSQHCTGEAADIKAVITCQDGTKKELPYNELYEDIKVFVKLGKLNIDQVIQERSGLAKWVHLSFRVQNISKNRKQFLKYNGSTYQLDVCFK